MPSKDEGKVVGLAAYGNPDLLLDYMKKKLYFNGIGFNKNLFQYAGTRAKIEKELKKYKREDIAAALQKNLEEVKDYSDLRRYIIILNCWGGVKIGLYGLFGVQQLYFAY